MKSIAALAAELRTQILFQVTLVVSVVTVFVTGYGTLSKTNQEIEKSYAAIRHSLTQNLQNGDGFQLEKLIWSLVSSGQLDKAILLDQDRLTPLASSSEKQILDTTFQSFSEGISLNKGLPHQKKIFQVTDTNGTTLGYFVGEKEISVYPILLSILLMAVLLYLFHYFLKMKLEQFSKEILTPLQDLPDQVMNPIVKEQKIKEIATVLSEVGRLREEEKQALELKTQLKQKERLYAQAVRVTHDIRSPLAALELVSHTSRELPEMVRVLLRSAINRVSDIAQDLLNQNAIHVENKSIQNSDKEIVTETPSKDLASQFLICPIETIVAESRIQLRTRTGVKILFERDEAAYQLFSNIDSSQLMRVLSNLVSNAIEAIPDQGLVTVILTGQGNRNIIEIRDTGSGIPTQVSEKLGQPGVTFGKISGNGYGFYYAKCIIESCGGTLEIKNQPSGGAIARIELPAAVPAPWFVSSIEVLPRAKVIVLDDDPTIHALWDVKFNALSGIELIHFQSVADFETYVLKAGKRKHDFHYLMDYELDVDGCTGLDLMEKHHLSSNVILVTSHYESIAIQKRCEALGAQLIPKPLASLVPVSKFNGKLDAVLIDNSELVRLCWQLSARSDKRKCLIFDRFDNFLEVSSEINKETPIYIDEDLGDGVSGIELSSEIIARGFHKVFIATGYSARDLPQPPESVMIVGKYAPWDMQR